MTPTELIAYYVSLLIMQYRTQPRAQATVAAVVAPIIAEGLLSKIEAAFSIDTAVGKQLDILAEYRGLRRALVGSELTRNYFSFAKYADSDGAAIARTGFARYSDDPVVGNFLRYDDVSRPVYTQSDEELRQHLKLRVAFHASSLSVGEIDDILFQFFGQNVVVYENLPLEVQYDLAGDDVGNLYKVAKAAGTFPKPAGVPILFTP